MNKTKWIWAAVLLFTAACANEDVNKDNADAANKWLTAFVSGDEPATRTSMDHNAGGKGKFFWTTDDNIWVDNSGTPESSTSSSITGKTNYAKFYFASTFPGTSYPVTYTGKSSTKANEVTIAATQTQSAPNNTDHFATSGDCGTATATGSGNEFAFKLKHQAAYLCILPRCENVPLGKNIYLTKVVVTSNNDIAGTYNLTSAGLTPKSGGTKTITLTTQGAGTDPGFKMTNTAADIDRNGAYMVIAPGTHTLTIDCYIKDPVTNVEGPITQTVSTTFAANTITDITANLTPTIYNNDYYMWDAQQEYWYGYKDVQPKLNNLSNDNYPKNNTDVDRWYNEVPGYSGSGSAIRASRSAANCPNINEILWYCSAWGDPYWDKQTVWATMDHLYSGGVWIKKKAHISGFSSSISPDGRDETTNVNPVLNYNYIIPFGKPGNSDDYFYLPAIGSYTNGQFLINGSFHTGVYWSSTPSPGSSDDAYSMYFDDHFGTSAWFIVSHVARSGCSRLWKAQ